MDCALVLRHAQHSLNVFLTPVERFMLTCVARGLHDLKTHVSSVEKHVQMYERHMLSGTCKSFVHTYVTDAIMLVMKFKNKQLRIHAIPVKNGSSKETSTCSTLDCGQAPFDNCTLRDLLKQYVWKDEARPLYVSCVPYVERFVKFRENCK
jgi:hypothetical protein